MSKKPAFPLALTLFALVNVALYGLFQASRLNAEKF
jgi:hypothetical protein